VLLCQSADGRLLRRAEDVLAAAVRDLRSRGLAFDELARALRSVRRAAVTPLPDDTVPYLIPNDVSLCTPRSVLNYSVADEELDLPAGFSIEASATKPDRFAFPYYFEPVPGFRTVESYRDRHEWVYDLSFVGQRGAGDPGSPAQPLVEPESTRFHFLHALMSEFVPVSGARIRLRLTWGWYRSTTLTDEQRLGMNERSRYVESVADSRFVLCPRGVGANSFRFFETLAACNIPIYVGQRETRLPLDWIIDWDTACFRISCEEVVDGRYAQRLREILATPIDEVNRRRRYIFGIHHQLLSYERFDVFEQLVLLRARALLRRRRATAPKQHGAVTR
jgi:hypothetical protein